MSIPRRLQPQWGAAPYLTCAIRSPRLSRIRVAMRLPRLLPGRHMNG
jgi:hypothetical protein